MTAHVLGLCVLTRVEAPVRALSSGALQHRIIEARTRELARHGMTDRKLLLKRLAVTKLDPAVSKLVTNRIKRDFPQPTRKR